MANVAFSSLYDEQQRIRPELLEWVPCNLCGSSRQGVWATKDTWSLVVCADCGLVYVNPRLNAEGLRLAYAEDYFTLQSDPEDTRKRYDMYRIEINDLERTVRGGRIVDVGANGGDFLAALGPHWEKCGCEVNDVAVQYAKSQHGLTLQHGSFRAAGYRTEFFDCVNLRGVIEHLPDPLAELREAHRVLKRGGVVAINTPNINSLCARIYRDGFRLVDPRFHIYYFSSQTMSRMLERAGFRVVREAYFYLDTPYADPLADLKTIVNDLQRMEADPGYRPQSPAFFENVLNIYAEKP